MNNKPLTGYPSIDKPWMKYFDCEFKESNIPDKSIYQFAYEENANTLDSIYLDLRSSANDFKKGIKITYRKFFDRVKKCAKAAISYNVRKDKIIPIILPNIPEARIAIYANSMIGAVSYPISPLLPSKQLEDIITANRIETVYIFKDFLPKYIKALEEVKNIILVDGTESLPKYLKLTKDISENNLDERFVLWENFIKSGKSIKDDINPYYGEDHVGIPVYSHNHFNF